MKHRSNEEQDLDLSRYQVRTDLAVEAHEMAVGGMEQKRSVEGVHIDEEEQDGIVISRVHIENEQGGQAIGKKPGRYITLEAQRLRQRDTPYQDQVTTILANEFHRFLKEINIPLNARCLIVGLGNQHVTPDALGPMVVNHIMVTNHLFELQPEQVEEGFRPVSAVSPGVLGLTGIETSQIVQGIVSQTNPDFIIAIDALAARSLERLNTTIQISDTGIHPGAGIGNKRNALDEETLGLPVIAIGVPTVVDAVSIVSDSMDFVMGHLARNIQENRQGENKRKALAPCEMSFGFSEPERFDWSTVPQNEKERKMYLGLLGNLRDEEKRQLIREVLTPLGYHLIVTPKEVDDFMEDMSHIMASGLNAALHDTIDINNVGAYTH